MTDQSKDELDINSIVPVTQPATPPAQEPAAPEVPAPIDEMAADAGEEKPIQIPNLDPVPRQFVEGDPSTAEPALEAPDMEDPMVMPMPSSLYGAMGNFQNVYASAVELPKAGWLDNLENADNILTQGEGESILSDPNRDWRRAVRHQSTRLGTRDLRYSAKDKALTGDNLLLAYNAGHATRGSGANTTFWGSGFSAAFKALDNTKLYDFEQDMVSSRIRAGRATFGLALSAQMVYTLETVLNTAEKALMDTTLAGSVQLGDAVRLTDFQTLTWGLAQATFSDGFEMTRSCMASPTTCNHVTTQKVFPRRFWLVDKSTFSDEQLAWIYGMKGSTQTAEDLEKYQLMFPKLRTKTVLVNRKGMEPLEYTFRVPTLNEAIRSGKTWIDEINAATVEAIGEGASIKERDAMMHSRIRAAAARQYAHWVHSIRLPGFEEPVTNLVDIANLLAENVSANDYDLANFMVAVREFHADMTSVQLVIANYKCPACNKHQMHVDGTKPEDEQPPMYIPIDPVSTFFGLTYRRLRRVAER